MCQPNKTILIAEGKFLYTSAFSWIKWADRPLKYDEAMEVIAYHERWIDPDFNPNGTRVGFLADTGIFTCAVWCDYQDCYETQSTDKHPKTPAPSHFMFMPYRPMTETSDYFSRIHWQAIV